MDDFSPFNDSCLVDTHLLYLANMGISHCLNQSSSAIESYRKEKIYIQIVISLFLKGCVCVVCVHLVMS